MMRFLVDRCAGRRLSDWLVSQGHDAVYAVTLGEDPGDSRLLELAAQQQRILITIDTDFGALVFLGGVPHSGIVRLPDVPAASRIQLMDRIIREYQSDLIAGSIITVRGNRIRVSRPQG